MTADRTNARAKVCSTAYLLNFLGIDAIDVFQDTANTIAVRHDQHVAPSLEVWQDLAVPQWHRAVDSILKRLGKRNTGGGDSAVFTLQPVPVRVVYTHAPIKHGTHNYGACLVILKIAAVKGLRTLDR